MLIITFLLLSQLNALRAYGFLGEGGESFQGESFHEDGEEDAEEGLRQEGAKEEGRRQDVAEEERLRQDVAEEERLSRFRRQEGQESRTVKARLGVDRGHEPWLFLAARISRIFCSRCVHRLSWCCRWMNFADYF